MTYTAKYEKIAEMPPATVRILFTNDASCTIDGYQNVFSGTTDLPSVKVGDVLSLHAVDADKVLQWQNEYDKVLGKGADLTVTVTGNMTITLVYQAEVANQAFVQFVSDNGQVMQAGTYTATDDIPFPMAPSKLGYRFLNWVFAGTTDEATEAAIRERIANGEQTIILSPRYERLPETYTVTVRYDGVQRADDVYVDLAVGTSLTLVAPKIEGKVFQRWEGRGQVLGYAESYYLKVTSDEEFTAVYGDQEPVASPIITISDLSATVEGGKQRISAIVTRSVPENYTLIEHGVLYARSDSMNTFNENGFVLNGNGVNKYQSNMTDTIGTVKLNVTVDNDSVVVWLRGYMIVQNDLTGEQTTYYTALRHGSYANPNPNA